MPSTLEERISKLPAKLRTEVEDFVNFLTDQNKKVGSGTLKQMWAGALKEDSRKISGVELQKQILK